MSASDYYLVVKAKSFKHKACLADASRTWITKDSSKYLKERINSKVFFMQIEIINGPNLNLLGKREPEKYGHSSFEDFFRILKTRYPEIDFEYYQSNIEGEIINEIQKKGFTSDGIILNAGGYTHTSVAITDAIAAVKTPVIEVHITNIAAREEFRHTSLIGRSCAGSISGFGLDSYRLAAEALIEIIKTRKI